VAGGATPAVNSEHATALFRVRDHDERVGLGMIGGGPESAQQTDRDDEPKRRSYGHRQKARCSDREPGHQHEPSPSQPVGRVSDERLQHA